MPISDCWLMIQQIKTVLTTINWLVIKILFSLAVAHSDSVLTWDFDNELSRCTYAGKLQWAPQWALARAEGWWVFGCLRLAWYVNCTLTAISGLCGFFFIFFIVFVLIPAAVAGTGAPGEEEEALPTYKDAFPPLPEKAASPEGTQETANAWTSKLRPLKASVITQV